MSLISSICDLNFMEKKYLMNIQDGSNSNSKKSRYKYKGKIPKVTISFIYMVYIKIINYIDRYYNLIMPFAGLS